MRRLTILPLLVAMAYYVISMPGPPGMAQNLESLDELVFVTEDQSRLSLLDPILPGCESITAFDAATGRIHYRSPSSGSPGRLAVAQGDHGVIAAANQSNLEVSARFASLLPTGQWRASEVPHSALATMAGIAFAEGGDVLIVAEAHVIPYQGPWRQNRPPFRIAKYAIDSGTPRSLGQAIVRSDLDDLVIEILVPPAAGVIHAVTSGNEVRTLSLATLEDVATPIPFGPFEERINQAHPTHEERLHADFAADGRNAVIGLGEAGSIASVDLERRTATTIDLPEDADYVGGVALNKGWINPGLLAVHGRDNVSVYRYTPPDSVQLLDRANVRPDHFHEQVFGLGPKLSIAWSGSGARIIAADDQGNAGEFAVFDFSLDSGLVKRHGVAVCPVTPNSANAIKTLNGLLVPTPTASATPTNSPPTTTASLTPPSTDTATPTQTSSPTPSSTIVPSPTATSTATSTPIPAPLYLPLLLGEECKPEERRAEVVMVLDASSSMLDPTAAGRSKLQAAIEAAGRLLTALDFGAGDRAGLVVFNEEVTLELSPTADPQALAEALAGIQAAPGTCIPCGVEAGIDLLTASGSGGAAPERSRALLLLTDGRSTVRPIEEAIAMAQAARAEGLVIFAVGLGQDVEEPALQAIVNRPAYYYRSLDAEALTSIFETIVTQIPCPPSRFWAGR